MRRSDGTKKHPGGAQPIAVIGMALRVPGANSLQQFWHNIRIAKDCLTRPTTDELRSAGVSRRQLRDPHFVRSEPLVTDVEYFDAPFFGMSGFEADRTEPAHRLFLECAWEALEAAAVVSHGSRSVVGVFAGGEGGYEGAHLSHLRGATVDGAVRVPDRGKELPLHLGNSVDFLSTRVSHKLNLTGPSFAVLAACSTSLLAIHLAVQSLRRRECEVAIAGGSSVLMPHAGGYISSIEGMSSPTGRIRPFDACADGTIFGSGVGVVVLKALEAALADGSPIWAVIRGSGASNDGNPESKESFIAPSREGQIAAVEAAMADAGTTAESIAYLEAHGTATLLGDPVEVASVTEVYRRQTSKTGYCALGSVKGNVGHLRTAAGVISLIKACLAVKHRTLPPVANFTAPSPGIDLPSSPFFISQEPLEWKDGSQPRRAAVSAFGFGGANAHVIVEENVKTQTSTVSVRRHHLLPFSAASETALSRRMVDLATWLDQNPGTAVADVAHTLQCGRTPMRYRTFVCVDDEASRSATRLRAASLVTASASPVRTENRPVVFLFPGQGAQRPGMGQEIYEREPLYRELVDRCAEMLKPKLQLDIRTLLHPGQSPADPAILRRTANAQPALFVVGYALARQYMAWGVTPSVMLGHSIGEIVAACIAGVFSLDDALEMVAARARLMQGCDAGAMAAVFLSEEPLTALLSGQNLEIAAVNAPNICIVSGPELDIADFLARMEAAGIGTRRIETSHAFHSRMMEQALPAFHEVLRRVALNPPTIPVISNTTGLPLTDGEATSPEYWSAHLRRPVQFSLGASRLLADRDRVFLELGPGRTLCDLIRQHDPEAGVFAALDDSARGEVADEAHSALIALGRLWSSGGAIDWQGFYGVETRYKLSLPTYPFERRRYWIEPSAVETKPENDLFLYEPGWRLADRISTESVDGNRPWLVLQDRHGVGASVVERLRKGGQPVVSLVPGDGFVERDAGEFVVQPDSREDLAAALSRTLARDGGRAPRVLHLWSLTGAGGEHNTLDAFRESSRTGFYTLIGLAQAAYDIGLSDQIDTLVVADGLRQIEGEETPLFAEKGALLGPVRNIAKEIPSISFRCADITGFELRQSYDELAAEIIAEAKAGDRQQVICIRPSGRYIEELYPYPAPPLSRMRLREGGTVLITGGVGGLGLKAGRMLFEAAQARLILSTRWKLPPRSEWAARAAAGDKIGRALKGLIELENIGAELHVINANMADARGLKAAIVAAEFDFGPINGVIHGAGVNTDRPAIHTTQDVAEMAFAAKVHSAFTLEEIFADRPLDFFVFLSSRSSYTPAPGQSIYTAANSVLDILASRRSQRQPGLVCAIGWGAWQETGMAAAIAENRLREPQRSTGQDREGQVELTWGNPLLKSRRKNAKGSTVYCGEMRDGEHWVCEHRFKGRALIAGATILECLRASYLDLVGLTAGVEFSQVGFVRPLFIEDRGTELEIEYVPDGDSHRFVVRSCEFGGSGDWTVNALGRAARSGASVGPALTVPGNIPSAGWRHEPPEGFSVGQRWDCISGVFVDGDTMWAHARLDKVFHADVDRFGLHPATFDRALNDPSKVYGIFAVPFTIDRISIHGRLGAEFFVQTRRRITGGSICFDALFVDSGGNILVETEGFVVREVEGSSLGSLPAHTDWLSRPPALGLAANQRIVIGRPGDLDSLTPREFEVQPLRAGEVRINVVAAGLNFRDVLSALGHMPATGASAPRVGAECSGVISEVADDVADLRPGDPVVALVGNAFSGSVAVHADLVMPVPRTMTMEDAAGIPIAFLTADYAINVLAGLKKRERILIHAASGGVGLAAVQLAQGIGAEIFATAGHPDKRRYLESLGIAHVLDSRSLEFVEEIRSRTGGEGVDVVLNSLGGEFIPASLGLLRYRGRFLEIGKRDILSNAKIGLLPFQHNLTYHAIDLGPMIERRDPELTERFDSLMLRFARGDLSPLPTAIVPIGDAGQAMQRMARAEHIGKIVLKIGIDPDPWRSVFRTFQEMYGRGIPVRHGLAMFRRLLSANRVPPYVMVLGQEIDEAGQTEHRVGSKRSTRPDLASVFEAPTTLEEKMLARIWENALGVAPIGINDDFFDLGGDSIIAVQTQFAVADQFGMNLSSSVFSEFPTIAALAEQIRNATRGGRAVDRDNETPLSMAEARLNSPQSVE